ncbi:MAG TPA: hypothetical protein VFD48_12750, partial [Pyrinomonadaceae bacterium]|nr:hypothetical protein [Pyrinomonadaceae bacterium]
GAMLMYLGTVLSTCAATMAPGRLWVPAFFFTLLIVFVLLLLFSRSLMHTVQELLMQDGPQPVGFPRSRVSASIPRLGSDTVGSALPPARGLPATILVRSMFGRPSWQRRRASLSGQRTYSARRRTSLALAERSNNGTQRRREKVAHHHG